MKNQIYLNYYPLQIIYTKKHTKTVKFVKWYCQQDMIGVKRN